MAPDEPTQKAHQTWAGREFWWSFVLNHRFLAALMFFRSRRSARLSKLDRTPRSGERPDVSGWVEEVLAAGVSEGVAGAAEDFLAGGGSFGGGGAGGSW